MTLSSASPPELTTEEIARFGEEPLARIQTALARVRARIERACRRAGRAPDEVRLLPISKTVPASVLVQAHRAGLSQLGENKIQEALRKHDQLAALPVSWSIVGHLQSNKAKFLARFAQEFQALDSLKLASELQHRLELHGRELDVFIQVNTSGESSKYGLSPEALLPFVEQLQAFPRLKPRGLMTLALFSAETDRVRSCFRLLRELRERALTVDERLTQLSMGMSGDYEIAIEEGATVVRIGQAIFGSRPLGDAYYWPGFAGRE